jgi:hypothetical protein
MLRDVFRNQRQHVREQWLLLREQWLGLGSINTRFPHVPTMLSAEELQLLFWLTSRQYTGAGAIVDCGPFLGGSTSALCAGLLEHPAGLGRDGLVHVYDRFTYDIFFTPWFAQLGVSLGEGDSFLPVYENLNAQYLDLLDIHPADILTASWSGGPIEILFIDICKSWEINAHVIRQFFAHLIPGRSLIVQQDQIHFYAFWLVLTMDWFRDYFERLGHVANGHSALYRCTRAIPAHLLATDLRTIPLSRKREAFERELACCDGWQYNEVMVGYYRMLMDAGDVEGACRIARQIEPQAYQHPINRMALDFVHPDHRGPVAA